MSETASLLFKPDGTCVGLYTEVIDLSTLGRLSIKRASSIEFDDSKQAWRVNDKGGFTLFTAPSRRECLEWEQQYFGNQIEREIHDRTDQQNQSPELHAGVCGKNQDSQVYTGCPDRL